MSDEKQDICPICNKPRFNMLTWNTTSNVDMTKVCMGAHITDPVPLYSLSTSSGNFPIVATLIESDFDKISARVKEVLQRFLETHLNKMRTREELERIVTEQEQRIDELFKQPVKHDGSLDERTEAIVQYGAAYPAERGIYINCMDDSVYLNGGQALSLLAWLRKEEQTLEKMAKEQENDAL